MSCGCAAPLYMKIVSVPHEFVALSADFMRQSRTTMHENG
jgi:hypothetical protein